MTNNELLTLWVILWVLFAMYSIVLMFTDRVRRHRTAKRHTAAIVETIFGSGIASLGFVIAGTMVAGVFGAIV